MIEIIQDEPIACLIVFFLLIIIFLSLPKKKQALKRKITRRNVNTVIKAGIKKNVQKRNPVS